MFSKKHFITEDIPDLTGKVAIVTGGNSGIGYTTARELTRKNAHVFIASRSKERGEGAVEKIKKETGKSQVEYLHLDLSNLKNVKKSAENFLSKNLSLHILINNAGIVNSWSLTEDGIQNEFGVNHVGHFLFTMTLLAKIEASAPSRIVIVSSTAHGYTEGIEFDKINQEATQSTWQRYCISKLSNVLFTKSLSKRVEGKEVYVNSVHPGFVDTSIARGFKSGFFVAKVLKCATSSISEMHKILILHRDLHLGNILKEKDVFLSDTGLNGSCIVRGVLPYMAPELLHNQPYTKKADLYSFGIIMAELTTGKPPFEDRLFDHHLAIDICKGLRPKFAKETPECYIALVKRLLDADPTKRPEAEEILMIINSWIKIFHESNENLSKEELIIKNEFDISNELISNLPDEINVSKYREPYISKIINFINLPIPVNLQDHSEGSQV
ncbi:3796_t:CDS:2 [Funneliformis geosporum]|uniref:3796_t:CDS:1 n=1 Tax=Funneliformis geosporum TaxID=1117311 RepID=A0A9W4SZI5_9GLOM|nr:3796_t:CDS:2 [Funneliformis geosporum]